MSIPCSRRQRSRIMGRWKPSRLKPSRRNVNAAGFSSACGRCSRRCYLRVSARQLVTKAHRQKAAVETILSDGGTVHYDYQRVEGGGDDPRREPPGPVWLRKLLGDDFVTNVNYATAESDDGLAQLAGLSGLDGVSGPTRRERRLRRRRVLLLLGRVGDRGAVEVSPGPHYLAGGCEAEALRR